MTDLKKPISRVSAGVVHESGKTRPIIVILEPPNIIKFRAKGCKRAYELTTEGCFRAAVEAHVRAEKRRKKKEKEAKKKARRK